jgi:predicted transcriptional regulator of viral defense system
MTSPLQGLRDVAEGQWGLVTLRQARAAGVAWRSIARLVDGGLLDRVAHGVYRVRAGPEPDHLGLRAAWLQLDPHRPAWQRLDDPDVAVVSHTSAAALFGVGDLRADIHEFTLPYRHQTRRLDVRVHRASVPVDQRLIVHGLPTTSAAWMVGDLLADHVDPDAVALITTEVLDRILAHPRDVAEALDRYAQRFGLHQGDGVALLDELMRRAGSSVPDSTAAGSGRP